MLVSISIPPGGTVHGLVATGPGKPHARWIVPGAGLSSFSVCADAAKDKDVESNKNGSPNFTTEAYIFRWYIVQDQMKHLEIDHFSHRFVARNYAFKSLLRFRDDDCAGEATE
jgi:hypothetical protein